MIDPLSDVLRSVRLVGGVFLDARFTAPWCVTANMDAGDCAAVLAAPAQLIAYHVITEGRLLLSIPGEPSIEVRGGEVVLLPHNDGHVLASGPGLEPVRAGSLIERAENGGLARIVHGGGGPATHVVCGFLATEERHNPLISTLPRTLKIDLRQAASRDWIEASVRFAAGELAHGRLASSTVMSRLSEVLLVEAVREYAPAVGAAESGWLKGMSDPYVARALSLMHRDIGAPWSAGALAKEVALSRSAFMERFSGLVGIPPIRYLTACRLEMTRRQLRDTRKSVALLAREVGYTSEEAFSRAFKRAFGVSPARWREGKAKHG
jgi:AraC-like DNA-binding protein